MPVVDTDQILEPVSADKPSGDPLDSDPAFLALEVLSQGTPERVMGDVVVPAEAPDWLQLRDQAVSLLERSKDLRVAILLLRALLHTDAVQGVCSGLTLLCGMIDGYWETLYPQPDEDDPTDQTERAMAFAILADHAAILSPFEHSPLVSARGYGSPCLRDIRGAQTATSSADKRDILNPASVAAAFAHCDIDQLKANAKAATEAAERGRHLTDLLAKHLPPDITPDLSPLLDLLNAADVALRAHLSERQPSSSAEPGLTEDTDFSLNDRLSVKASSAATPLGPITSRADVQRALDEICEYYVHHEPSSPLPLLLRRARRLATMSFIDIVQDLAPDSLDKIKALKGLEDEAG